MVEKEKNHHTHEKIELVEKGIRLEKESEMRIEIKIRNQAEIKFYKKAETVLTSHKSPYEKKIALFNCLKDIEVGELTPIEKERINFLLQSKLYAELAKKSMKEYEKSTVKDYSKKG
jgi:hypothetical protein